MEGAGKLVDDEELRDAMAGKGLGTPATRAAIIEGLLNEKYLLREGRELMPTAKAFSADDAAARPRRERADRARTDRRMGIQALADGARPASAREEFMREIDADDANHRQARQGIRQRHHPRRLRDA